MSAGPFVVTHQRPVAPDENGTPFCGACSHYHDGACLCPDCGRPTPCPDHLADRSVSTPATGVVYREAFATLEEDAIARRMFGVRPGYLDTLSDEQAEIVGRLTRLTEAGGRFELPDGSVIEVEATTWGRLVVERRAPTSAVSPNASQPEARIAILAAWNAEHGIGIGDER